MGRPSLASSSACDHALARRTLPGSRVDWAGLRGDYRRIRTHISLVVPGFDRFEERIAEPGGFRLPLPPREREFQVEGGRARFTVNALEFPACPPGRLLLQTMRSHDQYNTTVYGLDDRYRGVFGERRVLFIHRDDIAALGMHAGDRVDLESLADDGVRRQAKGFLLVEYDIPRGCLAAYYPETNALVPLSSVAEESRTPTSKSVPVVLAPHVPDADAARQRDIPAALVG